MKYTPYLISALSALSMIACSAQTANPTPATAHTASMTASGMVKTTHSGLKYKTVKEGRGQRPKANDEVEIRFTSYRPNGERFEGTFNNVPVILPLSQMFSGLQEGLMLMQPGGIYELYIPAHLGYQEEGSAKRKAVNYRVELLRINPK